MEKGRESRMEGGEWRGEGRVGWREERKGGRESRMEGGEEGRKGE